MNYPKFEALGVQGVTICLQQSQIALPPFQEPHPNPPPRVEVLLPVILDIGFPRATLVVDVMGG